MQDAGSLARVTLPGCARATLCISVSSTSHLKNKYLSAAWLGSAFLGVLSSHNSEHYLGKKTKENKAQFRLTHDN